MQRSVCILSSNPLQRICRLACLYALRGDRKNALFYLEDSLQKFGVTVDFVKQDEDWAAYLDDSGFTGLLKRFEKED